MSLLGEEQWLFCPPVPRDLDGVDLPSGLVTNLILRRLSVEGTSNLQNLSSVLKLPVPVVHSVFTILRQQQLVEVKGMVGNDYRISLSGGGRAAAAERFQISRYSGPTPVSLKASPRPCGSSPARSKSRARRFARRSPTWWFPILCWTSSVRR